MIRIYIYVIYKTSKPIKNWNTFTGISNRYFKRTNEQTNKRTSQSWHLILKRPRNAQWKCLFDLWLPSLKLDIWNLLCTIQQFLPRRNKKFWQQLRPTYYDIWEDKNLSGSLWVMTRPLISPIRIHLTGWISTTRPERVQSCERAPFDHTVTDLQFICKIVFLYYPYIL